MIKGSLKQKLFSLLFLVIAVGVSVYIYSDAKATREIIKVPVFNRDMEKGEKIEEGNIKYIEIGKYNMDSSIVYDVKDLEDKYIERKIYENRYIYKEDISIRKPAIKIKEKIKTGALAVETDLTKCVGGIPKPGDYVRVNVVRKNPQTRNLEVIQNKELKKLKILAIKNSSGEEVKGDRKESYDSLSNTNKVDPAIVVFEADKNQEIKLIEGQYDGDIHLVLLPENKEIEELEEPKDNKAEDIKLKNEEIKEKEADKEKEIQNKKVNIKENIDNKSDKNTEIKNTDNIKTEKIEIKEIENN